jgi:hypothetical protein
LSLLAFNLVSALRIEYQDGAGSCFDLGRFQRDVLKAGLFTTEDTEKERRRGFSVTPWRNEGGRTVRLIHHSIVNIRLTRYASNDSSHKSPRDRPCLACHHGGHNGLDEGLHSIRCKSFPLRVLRFLRVLRVLRGESL